MPSPLLVSYQPGGLVTVTEATLTTGDVWYVGSTVTGASNAAGFGKSPASPFATMDYANGVAASGDVVLVMSGHVETVSAAAGLDLDTANVMWIGLGWGSARPKIDFTTATTADVDFDAANITMRNFVFEASFADIVAALDINAANIRIQDCDFTSPTTDENALIWILGATSTTSNGLRVERCKFYGKDAANTHAISLPGTSDGCVINDNSFHLFAETAVIGAAGAVTNIEIQRNIIQNADTDADACINLAASSTGIVAYNSVGAALAGDVTTNITCSTGVVLIENYSVDTGDRQGVLDPVATT